MREGRNRRLEQGPEAGVLLQRAHRPITKWEALTVSTSSEQV